MKTKYHLEIQTANAMVRALKQARRVTYILELRTYLHGKFVEGSPSMLSLGRLRDELGFSHWWQPGENPERTEGKRTITCCPDNFVPCRGHKARSCSVIGHNSTWHDAAGNLVPGKEVAETLFRLLEPFSKRVVDDDAALVRNFPSADHEAGRNPHAKTSPPSVVADAGAKKGKRSWREREPRIPNQRVTTTCFRNSHRIQCECDKDHTRQVQTQTSETPRCNYSGSQNVGSRR